MSKIICIIYIFFVVVAVYAGSTDISDKNYDSARVPISREDIENIPVVKFVESPVLGDGEFIPTKYTCDGNNISPEIIFNDYPLSGKSIALICHDPDAPVGDWVHWIIFNIPTDIIKLPENIENGLRPNLSMDEISIQPIQGVNDFGEYGYGGPCPPKGETHRYYFKFYALDTILKFDKKSINNGVTKDMLQNAMAGHITSELHLMGKYKR